ncbi:coniferyl aldehyde dehydrogenase [Dyella mobilis]|uniref:Aldehyde dehydrogenase n=1 Tax=Dyella mobilis TaxID=1849582 RepID=A0ABS2KET1_9GAMM|nr:coniferyl aldehyde dehydrogenase [Dyella mobilis]MBM7129267.1 coniferyl aldehyde dehydrogenase [Dyella mobilis]GLQ98559.1 aldehyde dehydrogenase [Dyella mobilis]
MNQPDPLDLPSELMRLREMQRCDPLPDWATRARRLRALDQLVREHRGEIAEAIHADFGCRPREETDMLEVFPSLSAIRHALRHGRRWMKPRRHAAGLAFLPARTEMRPQPLGVVGIIVPWNYPLFLAVGPLIDALAAGNRVMVKMSEYTPRFSQLFAELVARHFQPDEVIVVNGDASVGQGFADLPFDHLLFTGSTAVGHHVMRAASANLTPVTLELGGKSPAIIGPGARFEHAVERIVFGKMVNAGQTCIAPDYVLLPRSQVERFITAARDTAARLYPNLAGNPQYASIASDRHYQRLATLRDSAVAAGAQSTKLADVEDRASQRVLTPVLLQGVRDDMPVMQEEIFGPLLPLVPYEHLDEAIEYVTRRPRPLALYLFEQDRASIDRVLAHTHAGGVSLNDTLYHIAQHKLPFGGIGPSGMGGYHGEAGFRTFSHFKPVFRQARFNGTGLLNPPYGKRFKQMLEILLRRA